MNWEEFDARMHELASKITWDPDIVVGIVRGGLVPARMLSTLLGVKDMYALTIQKRGDERVVTTEIVGDLPDKNVLLVEDMLETGKSMLAAKMYLESKGASVRTACLFTTQPSEMEPDYFLRRIDAVQQFPWE